MINERAVPVAAWLLTYAVHSTLLLAAAWLATRWLRGSAARDLLWKLAAFSALITATAQSTWLSREPAEESAAKSAVATWEPPVIVRIAVANEPAPVQSEFTAPATTNRRQLPSWQTLLVLGWTLGATATLILFARRYTRARRRFQQRTPVRNEDLLQSMETLRRRSGHRRNVHLTTCDTIVSPFALGHSEICLPSILVSQLTPAQRETMLAHELAHLRRRDPYWLMAFGWLESVFFFQPFNRYARKQFQIGAEELCDAWALAHTREPLALAQTLAEVARWLRGDFEPIPYPGMAESKSRLLDRVNRVLSGVREPLSVSAPTRWSAVALTAVFVVLAPAVSGAARVSIAPRQERQPTQPIGEVVHDYLLRLSATANAELRARASAGAVIAQDSRAAETTQYNSVPDRRMRVELINWLAAREDAAVRARLMKRGQNESVNRFALSPDGIFHFSFAARPEACGSGIDRDGAGMFALLPSNDFKPAGDAKNALLYSFDRDDFTRMGLNLDPSWTSKCQNGPVHALMEVRGEQVVNLTLAVGLPLQSVRIDTELGERPTAEAVGILLGLARSGGQTIAANAILAAAMAAQRPPYTEFLAIAMDETRPLRVRQTALHWTLLDGSDAAREAVRRNADRLPRGLEGGERNSIGEELTGIANSGVVGLREAIQVATDTRQPLRTRQQALRWIEDQDVTAETYAGLYDLFQDREMKEFLLQTLGDFDLEAFSRKLITVRDKDPDARMRSIAEATLRKHQNPVARAARF